MTAITTTTAALCPECSGPLVLDRSARTPRQFAPRQPLRGEQPETRLVTTPIVYCAACGHTEIIG